ncbi:MAG: DEDD exonuclease domain-containing protein, partial [Rhodothermales bacterium]
MHLSETPFVVVDTETTGVRPATERIIEIAAVRVVEGEITETYDQLINPDRIIPGRITQITGINSSMVYDQPTIDRVLPDFLEFLGDDIFVAHNLSFDLGFINAELSRLALPPLENTSLCTLRLARRLLRGLRSKGLTALAAFYGIRIEGRHRALGDAMATAEVLQHFLKKVQYENDVSSIDDLIRFQYQTYAAKKGALKNLLHIKQNVLPLLPQSPGVYFMRDGRKKVIYVGKAKNLKSRVKSYFNAIEGHETRTRNLVDRVKHITWQTYDSELEALLEESKLIKELKPRFNKAQKFYRNRPFIKLSVGELFPRASLHSYLVDDGSDYFGPVATRRQGELILDLINQFFLLRECDNTTFKRKTTCLYEDLKRCKAPCKASCERADNTDWYDEEVERVKRFLRGEDGEVVLAKLEEAMKAASIEMDYEQAAQYRDHKELVTLLLEKQRNIASPVLEHNAVVIDRSINDGHRRLLFVRHGRLIETMKCTLPPQEEERKQIEDKLALHFDGDETNRPDRYFKAEIEDIRLLAHWLYVNRDASEKIDWHKDFALTDMLDIIWQRL